MENVLNNNALQLFEIQRLKQKYEDIFLKKTSSKELGIIVCRRPTISEFNAIMLVYDSLNEYVGFETNDLYLQLQKTCIVFEFGSFEGIADEYTELLIELGEELFNDSNLKENMLEEKIEEQKSGERCTQQYGKVLELCRENPDLRSLLDKTVKDLFKTIAYMETQKDSQPANKNQCYDASVQLLKELTGKITENPQESKEVLKNLLG